MGRCVFHHEYIKNRIPGFPEPGYCANRLCAIGRKRGTDWVMYIDRGNCELRSPCTAQSEAQRTSPCLDDWHWGENSMVIGTRWCINVYLYKPEWQRACVTIRRSEGKARAQSLGVFMRNHNPNCNCNSGSNQLLMNKLTPRSKLIEFADLAK